MANTILLQLKLPIEEKPIIINEYPEDEITVEDLYNKEFEESEFDSIEILDSTVGGIEYAYADLFDIDMMIERGKTPDMDTLDYIYWELEKGTWAK